MFWKQRTFPRKALPEDFTVERVDAINARIKVLRAQKIKSFPILMNETPTHYTAYWTAVLLQSHIRRGLALIDGGLDAWKSGNSLVSIMCARTLMEDAALLWQVIQSLLPLLEQNDFLKARELLKHTIMASRFYADKDSDTEEFKAKNIMGYINRMVKLKPDYRTDYDVLSEIVHPNCPGVLLHFSTRDSEAGPFHFHDGEKMSEIALGSLMDSAYHFSFSAEWIHDTIRKCAALVQDEITEYSSASRD